MSVFIVLSIAKLFSLTDFCQGALRKKMQDSEPFCSQTKSHCTQFKAFFQGLEPLCSSASLFEQIYSTILMNSLKCFRKF